MTAAAAQAQAEKMIASRTDDQLIEDYTTACILNRKHLKAGDMDNFDLVNITITWIERELDKRFTIDECEQITDAAWDIADAS